MPVSLPSELSWVAFAVYDPLVSGGVALPEPHVPPLPFAVAVETSSLAELKIWTITGLLGSVPVPEKVGVVLFEGVGGWLRVTAGEFVLTVNVTVPLLPVSLPSELS